MEMVLSSVSTVVVAVISVAVAVQAFRLVKRRVYAVEVERPAEWPGGHPEEFDDVAEREDHVLGEN